MLDLECSIVKSFGWSLVAIDETDIESLIPFVFHYPRWEKKSKDPTRRQAFADQVNWL